MIDATTTVFTVLGNPVRHSLSPVMFNRAFEETGYNGVYTAFQVVRIRDAMDAVRTLGIAGASVTIPHKVAILDFLDELDPLAERIGAVNTVINRNGLLKGYNSDCSGAVQALEEIAPLEGKKAVIVGAGGAARAIAFGLQSRGAAVTIINRSIDRGEKLANDLGAEFIPLSEISKGHADLLIQTTSVGMTPDTDRSPVPAALLTPDLLVMDIVYTPVETRLLQDAAAAGCRVVSGLSMFVHQAAFQFELWTGMPAPRNVMKEALMDCLNLSGNETATKRKS